MSSGSPSASQRRLHRRHSASDAFTQRDESLDAPGGGASGTRLERARTQVLPVGDRALQEEINAMPVLTP